MSDSAGRAHRPDVALPDGVVAGVLAAEHPELALEHDVVGAAAG